MNDIQNKLIAMYGWYGAHLAWLEYDVPFEKNRADLRGADFSGADFSYADLRGADLRGVNLRYADLRGVNLRYADLRGADLRGVDFSYALGHFSTFYAGKHHAIATCSHINIGCERHTHEHWRENYAAIGRTHGYTDAEIERYRQWVFSLDWLMEDER